eukprot:c21920_g1_i1 orf=108-2288(-)
MPKCFPLPISEIRSNDDDVEVGREENESRLFVSRPHKLCWKRFGKFMAIDSIQRTPQILLWSLSSEVNKSTQQVEVEIPCGYCCVDPNGVKEGSDNTFGRRESKKANKAPGSEENVIAETLYPGVRGQTSMNVAEREKKIILKPERLRGYVSTSDDGVAAKGQKNAIRVRCPRLDEQKRESPKSFGHLIRFGSKRETTRQILERAQPSTEEKEEQRHCGCLANTTLERIRGWGNKKGGGRTANRQEDTIAEGKLGVEQPVLPDDVVEMCLARTPFSTLLRTRLVCKKWLDLTVSQHFFQMREKVYSQKPWLFLFGLSRGGACASQIQALDPTFDKWHVIKADPLSGRLLYSVAAVCSTIYVIGGCSSLPHYRGRAVKSSVKTHKGVLVYNPLSSTWNKICPMGAARAMPIVGVFEVGGKNSRETFEQGCGHSQDEGMECCHSVEDMGIFTVRRLRGLDGDGEETRAKSSQGWCSLCTVGKLSPQGGEACGTREDLEISGQSEKSKNCSDNAPHKKYGLIVVGGKGVWDEPLDSGEVYDPVSDKWRAIASLPPDHGVICAGTVCNGFFYSYSETNKLAAYDLQQNLWTRIQVSNPPVRLHDYIPKLVACRGRLVLLGVAWEQRERNRGNAREKALRMLWEFDSTLQTWREISKHPDAPLDRNAVFVSDGDHIFGVEMFKIFGQVLDFVTICNTCSTEVKWGRVSRMHMANAMDALSFVTKTAVVVQL